MEIDLEKVALVDLRDIMTPGNLFYFYRARVQSVVDGDTVDLEYVDYGMGHFRWDSVQGIRVRFKSINTWEQSYRQKGLTDEEWEAHKARGKEATAFLEALLDATKSITFAHWEQDEVQEIVVQTFKDETGNFGRLLADLYIPHNGQWIDVSETLRVFRHEKSDDGKVPAE